MKKILIINTVGFRYEGISSVILNYCRNMDKSDMTLDFVSCESVPKELKKEMGSWKSKVYELPNRKRHLIKYIYSLIRICKKGNYDVIHVNGNSATMIIELLIAITSRISNRIAHCHTSECTYKFIHNILNPLFKKTYTQAIACSEAAGNWIFDNYDILNNAIDVEKFKYKINTRELIRKKFMFNNDDIVIGNVGNFTDFKNQEYLISIFEKLDDKYKLLLIGDGKNKEKLVQKYSKNKNIYFLGSKGDVYNYMQAMDIFVFPSKKEGLGLVLIEAQVSGLHCITSYGIPKVADMGNLEYLYLNNKKSWIDKISCYKKYSRTQKSKEIIEQVINKGYSIKEESDKLKKIYMQ